MEREIMEIIEALDKERRRQGLTFQELAEKSDIKDEKTVRYMRSRMPTLQTLHKVIMGLELDICLVNNEGVNIL